jgi:DNA-binding LytR/AlgR family response regulator
MHRSSAHENHFTARNGNEELEEQLDPNQFWRIHLGIIVRVDQVVNARRDLRGRYTLKLKDRPESLRSSQSYEYRFKQMLGGCSTLPFGGH